MSRDVAQDRLISAVEDWIAAEHLYRHGTATTPKGSCNRLIEAERKLRRLVTGKGELTAAFQRLPKRSDL